MTSLDASALLNDPEGLDFLRRALGPAGEQPSLSARFGVPPRPAPQPPRRAKLVRAEPRRHAFV